MLNKTKVTKYIGRIKEAQCKTCGSPIPKEALLTDGGRDIVKRNVKGIRRHAPDVLKVEKCANCLRTGATPAARTRKPRPRKAR